MTVQARRKPCVFCGTLTFLVKRGTGESVCSPCVERHRPHQCDQVNPSDDVSACAVCDAEEDA